MDYLINLAQKTIDNLVASIPRTIPLSSSLNKIQIVAHRGAHDNKKGIIENTMEAFFRAQKLGLSGIELDIHATSDNVLVVNHDPTLSRLWGKDAAIANLSFTDLRQLEPNIPSLSEVVTAFGGKMHLFIELKAPFTSWEMLAKILKELKPCKDYHLITLDKKVLDTNFPFPKESILLVAEAFNLNHFCELSLSHSYGGVLGHYFLFTKKKMKALKEKNQLVGLGFINSKNSLYRELARDVDFLFTDKAEEIGLQMQKLKNKPFPNT